MNYKGYNADVGYDDEAEVFHGEVLGIRDVVTFEGKSVGVLKKAFRDSVDDYLDFCASRNESPEKPLSGKFMIRIPQDLHWQVYHAAKSSGKSINKIVVEWLYEVTKIIDADQAPKKAGTRRSAIRLSR